LDNFTVRKGKNVFIKDLRQNQYYELDKNANIAGHSNKNLTAAVKNNISSSWNLYGNTIYHKRFKNLLLRLFSDNYEFQAGFCLEDILLRINNFAINSSYSIEFYYENFNSWLIKKANFNNEKKHEKKIKIYDMAYLYLKTGGIAEEFKKLAGNLNKGDITVYNYFWHPDTEIITDNADLVILPEIFSGGFKYVNLLINKKAGINLKLFFEIGEIPSLYLASSMKLFYLIKRMQNREIPSLGWKDFYYAKRIFCHKNPGSEDYKKTAEKIFENQVIINCDPPYYNYLPLILTESQIKYLKRIKL
jgi:hypothetical protein